MRRAIKCVLLYVMRALGLFALARHYTRKGLRILCYHGGSVHDEHCFMPGLFMRPETFRRRLDFLARARYPVLGLGEALDRLANNSLPPCATVLTIDDGFYSTFHDAPNPLREHHFPATIYVTTYYAAKETPIFRLVVQYMFWKTTATTLNGNGLAPNLSGSQALAGAAENRRLCWEIINHAESQLTDPQRCDLARDLGKRLGIAYDDLAARRCFSLMTAAEIRTLADAGVDIQLHSHRHCCPLDQPGVQREITDNRAFLSGLVQQPLEHFCYPSGLWSREHLDWLAGLDVVSATTCDVGLNYPETPRHALLRFMDSDERYAIEFAAEVCGLSGCLRGLWSRLKTSRPATARLRSPNQESVPT